MPQFISCAHFLHMWPKDKLASMGNKHTLPLATIDNLSWLCSLSVANKHSLKHLQMLFWPYFVCWLFVKKSQLRLGNNFQCTMFENAKRLPLVSM